MNNNLLVCNNCGNFFIRNDETVTMTATLDDAMRSYVYCSKKCFDDKLSNINSNLTNIDFPIRIVSKTLVTKKPDHWIVKVEIENLRVI